MSFLLASIAFIVGTAGLFYLDRDKSLPTSKALWLPVIWLWIVGSRPASEWLGIWLGTGFGPSGQGVDAQLDGSPTDAFIFGVLLAAGIVVLIRRSVRTRASLKASLPILIYFAYCLISILWAPFPGVAFKRWSKAVGDLVMVLIVVTDADPRGAFKRLFSRVGFILLPVSVLLIKYSYLGRGYDPDGNTMITGVTTNKNSLGLITFVLALGMLWRFLHVLRAKRQSGRYRHLLALGTVLVFGVALLAMADSATSLACFALGAMLIFATYLPMIRRRPGRIHAVVLMILLAGGLAMVFGGGGVVHALGRQTSFTGRTNIWKAVIPLCPNSFVGAGFEGFWIGPSHEKLSDILSNWWGGAHSLNEAHNGYIEVYLNLGWVGVCLIAWILIGGYMRACAAFRHDPEIGGLMLAYVATAAIYSITEAGFRMLAPIWIFLLLAVAAASGTAYGIAGGKAPRSIRKSAKWDGRPVASGPLPLGLPDDEVPAGYNA